MTISRTSELFLNLSIAAADEKLIIARARADAAALVEERTATAHARTVDAAKRALEAGMSEYMLGQATGINGYHQRRRLAQEAAEAVFHEGTTASSFTVEPVSPDDAGAHNIYVVKLDTGRTLWFEYFEGDLVNTENADDEIEDGLAILESRGFLGSVLNEVNRLRNA